MLGDFTGRVLVLVLGYAYPVFECLKTVEKNELQKEELRFWCQYWIIVTFVTVFEKFSDALVLWLPIYPEFKLGLFIYLSLLQPYVVKYEPELEEKLQVLRAKAAGLLLFYLKNFTSKGQSMVLEVLHYVISQSSRLTERGQGPGLSSQLGNGTIQRSVQPPVTVGSGVYAYANSQVAQFTTHEELPPDEHAHRTWESPPFTLIRRK